MTASPRPEASASRSPRRVVSPVFTAVLCVASVLVLARPAAAAELPTPVMRGYVPLEANATQAAMEYVHKNADAKLDFTVGITNAAPGAVIYYDHHEDGFETDLTTPQQSTTQIWGDDNPANGNAAAAGICGPCTSDILPAGAVFTLRNDIDTPHTSAIVYDGGDRVSSTRGFTITDGGYTLPLNSVMSFSASAYDTTKWGTDYWIPVGENMDPPDGASDAFDRTTVQVMADQPGTVVQLDKNGDGSADQTGTIGAGEVFAVAGGLNRGARVLTSKPVQVHVGAGDHDATYELRWFTLFPTPLLSADYLNPVGSSEANQETVTYLFNPGDSPITITPSCTGCSGTISVAAKGGGSYRSPLGKAVRFRSSGGEVFVAVGAAGPESGVGAAGDESSAYDWGFGLVPTGLLTTKALLGWAPGNSAKPPTTPGAGDYDDNPVWISALADTTLYVDYDGNPATSSHTAPCGGAYDATVPATALASVRIFDAGDGDMTGASIFSCDTKIAGAWGEDPDRAPGGAPGFDAGYTLIPSTSLLLDKTAGLASDTNRDGRFGPGDVIGYEIAISNAGALSFSDVKVTDAVPVGTSYVAGSTTFDTGGASTPIADDGTGTATPYPFDEGGAGVPEIQPGQTGHIRYQVAIKNPFPAGTSITNLVNVDGPEDAQDKVVTPLVSSDLSLDKILAAPAPTYLGDNAVFRLVLNNDGPDAAEDVVVKDVLPAGLEFVSATASNGGAYDKVTGQWTAGSVPKGASRTLEITAKVNVLNAINGAEIVSSRSADPDSTPGNNSTTEDDDAVAPVTVAPLADLELTKAITDGPNAASETAFTLTLINKGPGTSSGVTVTEYPPPSGAFVSARPLTSTAVDGTFDGANAHWAVPDLAPGTEARMEVVYRTPVAPEFNFVQVTTSAVHDPDSVPDTLPLTAATPPDQDDEAKAEIPAIGDVKLNNVVTEPAQYVGDTVKFTVTVTNDGPTNTTGVNVVDKLPPGLEFVESDPSVGTYNPSTGVWTIGDMANGATRTLVITARVAQPGPIATTAEVTSSTAQDKDSTPGNHQAGEDDQADAPVTTTGASLGDTLWFDRDLDFVKDGDEPGLPGVKVTARWAGPNGIPNDADDQEFPTTTGANGAWSLAGLPHGRYTVTVDETTLPNGITTASQDRDGKTTAHSTTVTLDGGANLTDVDFAYAGSGLIGDTVFLDTNGNGTPDTAEGIPGVTVTLVWQGPDGKPGGGDDVEYTTVTNNEGHYEFPNLPAGPFSVTVGPNLPAGVHNAVDPDGGNNGKAAVSLQRGETKDDIDFGYVGTNTIGDRVFSDLNGDGVQQPGEPGLGGVLVTLQRDTDGDGAYETTVDSVPTAGNGEYRFEELPAGLYRVKMTAPDGLELTTPATASKAVASNETFLDADFGLKPPPPVTPGSIGDLVWDDLNGNGAPDPGEPGIAGARVSLRAPGTPGEPDEVVAAQTTGPDGSYSFGNLPPGTYRVTVEPPDGYRPTTPITIAAPLTSGATVDTADFGLTRGSVPPGSIGDRVWKDADGDGVQDTPASDISGPEPGVAGVEVTLRADRDGDGTCETVVGNTTTGPDGTYHFTDLPPGSYRVVVTPPDGEHVTTPPATVDLGPGQNVDTADFGLTTGTVPPGSIGDRIWLDSDRDGVQDPDEPGVDDITVTLRADRDGDGTYETVVGTTKTSGDGNYTFPGLPPGLYLVVPTAPDGLALTVPPAVVPLVAGQSVATADLGLAPPAPVPFDLEVVKVAETTPFDGKDMTWLFTVTNNGIGASPAALTVTDTLPNGLSYRSASGTGWTCSAKGHAVTCNGAGPLARGATTTFRIITTVALATGKQLLNGATVAAAGTELTDKNNRSQFGITVGEPPVIPAGPTSPLLVPTSPPAVPDVVLPAAASLPVTGSDIAVLLRLAALVTLSGFGMGSLGRRRRAGR